MSKYTALIYLWMKDLRCSLFTACPPSCNSDTGCGTPPVPDAASDLELFNYTAGTVVVFGDSVTYACKAGGAMEDDQGVTSYEVQCLNDNSGNYDVPTTWPQCRRSEYTTSLQRNTVLRQTENDGLLLCRRVFLPFNMPRGGGK